MPRAIKHIDDRYDYLAEQYEQAVSRQAIDRYHKQQVDDSQLEYNFLYANVGINIHALAGYDDRVIRGDDERGHAGKDGKLVDPVGRDHPVGGYRHLAVKKPQPHGLTQHHHNHGQHHEYRKTHAKHLLQPHGIAAPQLKGEIPLGGHRHRVVQYAHHGHHAAHNIIYTEVGYTKRCQNNPAREQRDGHHEEHPYIKQQRVLGDALVVDTII